MRIVREFIRAIVEPKTLTELVAEEMARATLLADQARSVINSHEFQLHMARAQIAALEAWNHLHEAKP